MAYGKKKPAKANVGTRGGGFPRREEPKTNNVGTRGGGFPRKTTRKRK